MLRTLSLALCCILLAAACGRSEETKTGATTAPAPAAPPVSAAPAPFRVSAIELGPAIGPDKRVSAPSSSFAATDTIYASVASEGSSPSVALTARWTYEDGQLVNESTEVIAPSGPAVTEFHIEKPGGWPTGKYRVEIAANGATLATREFEVR
jgi:hypothetical protein